MDKEPYFDILDQKRMDLLPLLKPFKDNFYLAGGTALALLLGHRDSFDFDFFSSGSFKHNKDVSFKLIKKYLAKTVKEYLTEVNK